MTRTPTTAEVIRQAIEDRLTDVHVALPGRIEAYDRDTQKADVQPLIRRLQKTIDGEISEELPVIAAVPVAWPRAGGFFLSMPVTVGDFCLLVFCERSIDNYQIGAVRTDPDKRGKATDPESFQMHDLSDAVALMGWYPDKAALSPTDADDLVIGEEGGPGVFIGGDEVNLYEKAADQLVALADKSRDELDKAKANAQAAVDYATAIGTVFAAGVPGTADGGAALQSTQVTALALIPVPTLADPTTPAATKVRAT